MRRTCACSTGSSAWAWPRELKRGRGKGRRKGRDGGAEDRARKAAEESGIVLNQGVYAGLRGPQYETPAEVRMLRTLGADAVGMSTVLEAIQARALGMRVAGFSCLTNWASGMQETLNHEEVLKTGKAAGSVMAGLLEKVLGSAR